MFLDQNKIQLIDNIIENYNLFFIVENIGAWVLSDEEKNKLKSLGVKIDDFISEGNFNEKSRIKNSFLFGLITNFLDKKDLNKVQYKDLIKYFSEGKFIPLSDEENFAIRQLEIRSYHDIKGLGNKISNDVNRIIGATTDNYKEEYLKALEDEAKKALVDRKSIRKFKSEIGHQTADWQRDLDRVADTLMHEAYSYGRILRLKKIYSEEKKVWMQVYNRACKHCQEKYLTNGIGSEPRIFKISDLLNNGRNIDKKVIDWKAVVPPMHPFCRCNVIPYEENSTWSAEDQMFVLNKYEPKTRKSRAKITIDF